MMDAVTVAHRHLPETLVQTRRLLHSIAESILSTARYRATGRIGLDVLDDGFATPSFGEADTVLAIRGTNLVVATGAAERWESLTTLRRAAAFVGLPVEAIGSLNAVYPVSSSTDLDQPIELDAAAAHELARWYANVRQALEQLSAQLSPHAPSPVTLWPEHFDVAIRVGQTNFGGLGGDDTIPCPYAYVGPTSVPVDDAFFNVPFGAARDWHDLSSDTLRILEFFQEGWARGQRAADR